MVTLYTAALEAARAKETTTHEGGRAFALDPWTRLTRLLVLGSAGGTFYVGARELTREHAEIVERCLEMEGARVVAEIVAISEAGRAPKHEPVLFALALATASEDLETRRAALAALPRVARTGTHLFHFARYVQAVRGWGRALRRAVGDWYNAKEPAALVYQAIKYRQRDGWTHADLLRLAHSKAPGPVHDAIYRWIVDGELGLDAARGSDGAAALDQFHAFRLLQGLTDAEEAARLIRDHKLPREAVPTPLLTEPGVWAALLEAMPLGAMLRNLGVMSKVGLLAPRSAASGIVCDRLGDRDRLRAARVHPIAVLAALKVYAQGHGERGSGAWTPVTRVVDALDGAFYAAFENVAPTGKRIRLALDVSGSMDGTTVAGLPFLSAREASAVMALVTARIEPDHEIVAYGHTLVPVTVSPRQRLDDVLRTLRAIPMGGTYCALPIREALRSGAKVDAFVSYTDSETWDGNAPATAWMRGQGWDVPDQTAASYLRDYREATGLPARHVVVGMCSNGFSLADPADPGQLDVVGFDATAPAAIADFVRGAV
ncbi:MAG: TROVE domain-containing protein [Chloroflexota bacterium]|nr:TROVE domain-containing protein [Chloroflexota bacterium]